MVGSVLRSPSTSRWRTPSTPAPHHVQIYNTALIRSVAASCMEGPSSSGPSTSAGSQQVRDFFEVYGEANRYTIHEMVGKGSYGIVCSATDNNTKQKVRVLDSHRSFVAEKRTTSRRVARHRDQARV